MLHPVKRNHELSYGEDDQSSPEYLTPVKDPYSSDDENEKGERKVIPHFYYETTYNGSEVSLKTLDSHFNLEFHSLSELSQVDIEHLDISEILNQIISFVTNKSNMTGKQLTNIIMEKLKFKESNIYYLYKDPVFHINLKEQGPKNAIPRYDKTSKHAFQSLCHFMKDIVDLLQDSQKSVHSSQHHDIVKMCASHFCGLTGERVIYNPACATVLTSMNSEDKPVCNSHITTLKVDGTKQPVTFNATPDLLLAGIDCPGIPIEVFSPQKIEKTAIPLKSEVKKTKISDIASDPKNEFTDDESTDKVREFLSKNIPAHNGITSHNQDSTFKDKMVSQHVLQILGAACQYCGQKYFHQEELQSYKVFIGLFVCNEYVYITKLVADEIVLAKYYLEGRGSLDYDARLKFYHSLDQKIHVQFSPMAFDISIHNHRMALLIFLEYYILMWNDITNALIIT